MLGVDVYMFSILLYVCRKADMAATQSLFSVFLLKCQFTQITLFIGTTSLVENSSNKNFLQ